MPYVYNDLLGKVFDRLTVIEKTTHRYCKKIYWVCQCVCGVKLMVLGSSLVNGHTKSCGCFKRESKPRLRHGHSSSNNRSRTYQAWVGLRNRNLYDPNWELFENFLSDMGEAPDGMSLDRIDNSKGYFKANCRWATYTQQTRNRTVTKLLTFNGVTLPLAEWAEKVNLPYNTLYFRIYKEWPVEEALFTPMQIRVTRVITAS